MRQELKRERKRKHKVRLETLKLNRAPMPLGKVRHLSASSRAIGGAGLNRALMPLGKVGHLSASPRAFGGAGLVCEC